MTLLEIIFSDEVDQQRDTWKIIVTTESYPWGMLQFLRSVGPKIHLFL